MKQFHIGILKHKGRKMIIDNEILYVPTQHGTFIFHSISFHLYYQLYLPS